MTERIKVLQNAITGEIPSIRITSLDPEWEAAYNAWLIGKNPTSSPEWKQCVVYFCEDTPVEKEKSLWETDYWHEGNSAYDFFMKRFACGKCEQERTKALCQTCIDAAAQEGQAKAERDKLALPPISSEMFRALADSYASINGFFFQLDQFFDLLRQSKSITIARSRPQFSETVSLFV